MRMLRVLVLPLVLVLASCGSPRVRDNPKLADADEVVWLGIDYSAVKMVGIGAFNEPAKIFPGFLEKWNGLFLDEMMPELRARVRRPLRVDIDAVVASNQRASARQIVNAATYAGTAVTPQDVERIVRGYHLNGRRGVGLVFVMDTMLKHEERACLYTTFVDLRTHAVIDSQHGCYPAGGFGFRNYWFAPIKAALAEL